MPRRTEDAEPAEPKECLEFDDNEEEEVEEEEIEYEEIEEEVEEEVEEDEDISEEVEEVEEEEEEDPEEREVLDQIDASPDSDSKSEGVALPQQDGAKDGSDKEKHAELLALPPHGSEVYVGGISSDASSEDLKKLCEPVGEVVEVRIMLGKKDSRGYAFVTFRTNDLALKAIEKLNNATFKGKRLKVSSSQAKNKLFVGNVPHSWSHDDFTKAVKEVGPGVLKVDLIKDPRTDRNRGYGFVEYYNNACAEYSRQKMTAPNFKLDTNAPTVSWADPKNGDSASTGSTSQVKSVYVKNLPKNVTQGQLKKLFERHGEIIKIVLPPSKDGHDNRYGFVHFKDRHMAMKAVKSTEKYELDGQLLDCSLAKPPADKKDDTVSMPSAKGGPLLHAPLGYGMPRPDPYGAPPACGAPPAYGGQPLLYAPGAPPGAAMVPMLLPDGRLVYVVQQPGAQQHFASPPPQVRQHQHFASPPPQARQSGRHGGSGGGGGSGGSSRSGSGTKRPRGDDNNSSSRNRQRRY